MIKNPSDMLGSLLGIGLLLSFIVICLSFWKAETRAKRLHAERMKAMEAGVAIPEVSPWDRVKKSIGRSWTTEAKPPAEGPYAFAEKCFSAAFWIALMGFIVAMPASGAVGGVGISIAVASATGASVMTALICGTVLACQPTRQVPLGVEKPSYEHEEV